MLIVKLMIVYWLMGMGGFLKYEVIFFILKFNCYFIISKKYGSCLILEYYNFNEFLCFLLKFLLVDVLLFAIFFFIFLSSIYVSKYGIVIFNRIFVGGIVVNVSFVCL